MERDGCVIRSGCYRKKDPLRAFLSRSSLPFARSAFLPTAIAGGAVWFPLFPLSAGRVSLAPIHPLRCSECEQTADECEQVRMIASRGADNLSTDTRVESVNPSRKRAMIASRPPDDCKRLHLAPDNGVERAPHHGS